MEGLNDTLGLWIMINVERPQKVRNRDKLGASTSSGAMICGDTRHATPILITTFDYHLNGSFESLQCCGEELEPSAYRCHIFALFLVNG